MAKTNKGRKFFATTASAALVASAIVPVASAAQVNDFNSIASYAQEAVQDLVDRGVVQGDANGNFQPRKSVSRAEAATILTGALGLTTDGEVYFTDVKSGAWYYDAINAAVNNGVFSGKGAGIFEPNGNLTRGEAAVILVNAFGLEGSASLAQFADEKSVKAWAQESLEIAVGNGVIKGDNGKIKANDAITKQDFAVMFSRAEAASDLVSASTVKAINNTTVEVTFGEKVEDIKDLNFTIEGLEVKNAVVKLTDNKTVVVTTSAQEAGKTYEVKVNDKAVGKFTGLSAVLPKSVEMITNSQQAVYGQQVTVKAEVTVEEGESKAGIPLTFIVASNGVNATPSYIEVSTDENGVAQHTYTQYTGSEDTVTVYATAKADIRNSAAKVYWGNAPLLTVTEVTEGNTLVNGSKKIYKIKARDWATDASGNKYVNIAFKENIDVAPNKVVTDVEVIDRSTGSAYPYQYSTTTTMQQTRVYLNADNEATFTLDGADAAVTPIVFVDSSTTQTGRYVATYLQQAAPTVTFEATQLFTLEVTSVDQLEQSAAIDASGTGQGGRTYKAVVKDKEGKVVPNARVQIAFKAENITKNYFTNGNNAVKVVDSAGLVSNVAFASATSAHSNFITLQADSKGEVDFRVIGFINNWAIPTVVIDNGSTTNVLDKADVQADGPLVHFVNAIVEKSNLTVKNGSKETLSFGRGEVAEFTYSTADQNGNPYYTGSYLAKFEITAGNDDVQYSIDNASWTTVAAGTKATVTTNSVNGLGKVYVKAAANGIATSAKVNASASQGVKVLPSVEKTATFSPYTAATTVTGTVATGDVDFVTNQITLNAIAPATGTSIVPLNPTGAAYKIITPAGNYANSDYNEFLSVLNGAQVTVEKDINGNYTYYIVQRGTGAIAPPSTAPSVTPVSLTAITWGSKPTAASTTVTTPAVAAKGSVDTALFVTAAAAVAPAGPTTVTIGSDTITFTNVADLVTALEAAYPDYTFTINATTATQIDFEAKTAGTAGNKKLATYVIDSAATTPTVVDIEATLGAAAVTTTTAATTGDLVLTFSGNVTVGSTVQISTTAGTYTAATVSGSGTNTITLHGVEVTDTQVVSATNLTVTSISGITYVGANSIGTPTATNVVVPAGTILLP